MANFIQDLRYGIRMMAKRPGFTLIAALTLALGIGANTAIFSAVNAVLLKPLPFPESEQLIDLAETFKPNGFGSVSVPTFEDWKNQNTVFAGISAYWSTSFNLGRAVQKWTRYSPDADRRAVGRGRPFDSCNDDGRFYQQVLERVSHLPGVQSAGLISHLPIEEQGYNGNISVEGKTYPPNESPLVEFRVVSDDYFQTADIPLLRGRIFAKQEGDDKQPVVVINEAMAKQIWPGEDPVGKRLKDDAGVTVIGVVGDVKNYGLLRQPAPEMYAPYTLKNLWPDMRWNMRLLVRSTLDNNDVAAAVRREVQSVDPTQPIYAVQTMNLVIENTVRDKSLNTTLLSVLAGVSLLLAVIGVYGVMSYTVAQHTREIGIRMALGARPRTILKLIMGRGLVLVSVGVVIGVLASFGLTRFIENMLFGVTPTDPLTFLMIISLLGIVALLACLIPAQRAMRVDPIVVLRHQ